MTSQKLPLKLGAMDVPPTVHGFKRLFPRPAIKVLRQVRAGSIAAQGNT